MISSAWKEWKDRIQQMPFIISSTIFYLNLVFITLWTSDLKVTRTWTMNDSLLDSTRKQNDSNSTRLEKKVTRRISDKETLYKMKNMTNYARYVTNHAERISVLKNTCIVKIKWSTQMNVSKIVYTTRIMMLKFQSQNKKKEQITLQ